MTNFEKHEGYTEGEWTVDIDSYDEQGDIVEIARHNDDEKTRMVIAKIYQKSLNASEEEKANARLLADAPRLLAENKRLREKIKILQESWELLDSGRIARSGQV